MRRRDFLKAGSICAMGAAAPFASAQSNDPPAPKRPNVLFIISDDQAYNTIHALDNPRIRTPHLDKLVERGAVFRNAYNMGAWNGAVCIASRAMLFTGMYVNDAQSHINDGETQLLGETFQQAGYDTFITGKWHNGNGTVLRCFEEGKAIGPGMCHSTQDAYNRPSPNDTWGPADRSKTGHWQPWTQDIIEYDGKPAISQKRPGDKHSSELYADCAIGYLAQRAETAAADRNPYFMYVSFNAPHDPRQAPQEYIDTYPVDEMALPPNHMVTHPFDQGDAKVRDEKLAPFPRTEASTRLHLQEYYAIITHMDAQIGRIFEALEASGEADNTLIVFTSDHGLAVGSHGLLGKQNQYEHSARVPLLIAGPGVPAGFTSEALCYLQCAHPTVLDLCGIETPKHVDYQSLAPALRGESATVYDSVYGSYRHMQRMARTPDWKIIRYPHNGEKQLFHLAEDPHELRDLAEDPKHAEQLAKMDATLREWQTKAKDWVEIGDDGRAVNKK